MINPQTGAAAAVFPQTLNVHVRRDSDRVLAAGGLIWKEVEGRLRVLAIHRPRYDDWSWPKGKLDAGETLPECAVREVREEVGIVARLGLPLPSIHYRVAAGQKSVYYWAIRAGDQTPTADMSEVDAVRWMTPDEARAAMTNPSDVPPLDYLEAAHKAGLLETQPLVVTRHAKAKPRSKWSKPEEERPLSPSGFRQASALAELIRCWKPRRVVTSPWARCVQTMQPFIKSDHPRVKQIDSFTERSAKSNPKKTSAKFAKLLRAKYVTVYCGHRPVMPIILRVLRAAAIGDAALALPAEDPYLRPGAVLICHQPIRRPGSVLAFEIHEPFDD